MIQSNELIKDYDLRLREMATQVYPFLLENELTTIFIDTLDASYFDYLIGNLSTYFIDMVKATKKMEQWLELGRIRSLKERFDVISAYRLEDSFCMKSMNQDHSIYWCPI